MTITESIRELNLLETKYEYIETPVGVSNRQWLIEERGFTYLIAEAEMDGFKSYTFGPWIFGEVDYEAWVYPSITNGYTAEEVFSAVVKDAIKKYEKLYWH